MDSRIASAFLLLVCAQVAHSIEEYVFRLYDVFTPARVVSGLFSSDLGTGFAIANLLIVAFGFWCYFARVRPLRPSARSWIWPWIVVEAANGVGHPAMALARGGYFPGVATAPLLLIVAAYLAWRLRQTGRGPGDLPGAASLTVTARPPSARASPRSPHRRSRPRR
jgi:hypothetical protein